VEVPFRGDRDEDEVVPDSDLLALWPLLWCWVDGPPARLAL
jgi:hypothetical protein